MFGLIGLLNLGLIGQSRLKGKLGAQTPQQYAIGFGAIGLSQLRRLEPADATINLVT